jgi:hypothetical protein
VAVLVIGVAGYFFLASKSKTPSENVGNNSVADNATKSSSPCKDLGLPEGSYVFEYDVCSPTEDHQMRVNQLSQEEYNSGDEHQLAFIKNVYEKSGEVYIDADYFQWLSHSDGSCIIPSDTSQSAPDSQKKPECNPNGFLIVNDNPKIRTFKLSSDVKIRLLEEFGNIPDLHTLTPQEFMNGQNKFGKKFYVYAGQNYEEPYYIPFQLILKGGQVKFIHQIYVP